MRGPLLALLVLPLCTGCAINPGQAKAVAAGGAATSNLVDFGAQVGDSQALSQAPRRRATYGFPELPKKPIYVRRPRYWTAGSGVPESQSGPASLPGDFVVLRIAGDGGSCMSYDPELRRMGLKVGRDGNLHEIGPDARHPGDRDEGPAVGWDELHRRQFGR
jgi:hypothetical protein